MANLSLLIFAAAIALAFAGVRWLLARLGANGFLVDFLSSLAAALVLLSHSLLGVAV